MKNMVFQSTSLLIFGISEYLFLIFIRSYIE